MITVDNDTCTECGSCVEVCHEHCMELVDGAVVIDYETCSTCTQCIAICPQQALSWDHTPPVAFDRALLPSAQQLDELFKERRTVRDFTPATIDREKLEEIVAYGAYAPTHNFNFRLILIDDEELLALIDRAILRFVGRFHRLVFGPELLGRIAKALAAAHWPELVRARPKLERALEGGRAFRSMPPAIVLVVGDRRVPLSEASAQYAVYNMTLYAQVIGLGARNLVGNQMILNRSKAVRTRLQLGKHERIFGTLGLGYPAVRFSNKVRGRALPIQWNEGASHAQLVS